jgi:hypothetical protein
VHTPSIDAVLAGVADQTQMPPNDAVLPGFADRLRALSMEAELAGATDQQWDYARNMSLVVYSKNAHSANYLKT